MIKLYKSLPKELYVACSGGVDSVALALFLKASGRKVNLVHYNHPDDPFAETEEQFVSELLSKYNFDGKISSFHAPIPRDGLSKEVWWRENRLAFFRSIGKPILTGHHLDDALEWYLLSLIKTGNGYLMQYESECTLKPLLMTRKVDLIRRITNTYPEQTWLDDPTNDDPEFNDRNFLRINVLPGILRLNPGFHKKIIAKFETRRRDEIVKIRKKAVILKKKAERVAEKEAAREKSRQARQSSR